MSNNRYGLPDEEVNRVRKRDQRCVYCHKEMIVPTSGTPQNDWATIEHLNHLPPWDNPKTIAICCGSCNSSRGQKPLLQWFESFYCIEKSISPETVSEPVLEYIREYENYRE